MIIIMNSVLAVDGQLCIAHCDSTFSCRVLKLKWNLIFFNIESKWENDEQKKQQQQQQRASEKKNGHKKKLLLFHFFQNDFFSHLPISSRAVVFNFFIFFFFCARHSFHLFVGLFNFSEPKYQSAYDFRNGFFRHCHMQYCLRFPLCWFFLVNEDAMMVNWAGSWCLVIANWRWPEVTVLSSFIPKRMLGPRPSGQGHSFSTRECLHLLYRDNDTRLPW